MGITAIVLDTSPLGLVVQKPGKSPEADACRAWMKGLLARGFAIYIPEIADYELRRELIRAGFANSVARLDGLKTVLQYLPITTPAILQAAALWAQARNIGVSTADRHALDGDIIVCAQALSLSLSPSDFIVATSNVKHLARFVPADEWQNIKP